MKLAVAALLGLALFAAAPAAAEGIDCPLAREPFSSRSILSDILIDPGAKAVFEREAPDLLHFGGPTGPLIPTNFARIVQPAAMLAGKPNGAEIQARLDKALAPIPVTEAVMKARCAPYDQVPPQLPAAIKHPSLLVFDKITGFRDDASVAAAEAALKEMAKRRGWTIVFSDRGAVFNASQLARFDTVVWNNVSGDALTLPQRRAFQAWLAAGGGFAGIHGAGGDPYYPWGWYADELLGARFIGHPGKPQFQNAKVVVEPGSSAVEGLAPGWEMTEEWYSFAASPRLKGSHILASLDEPTYKPLGHNDEDLRMGADHPIAWTRCLGNGRSFYTAIGHRPESYTEPHAARLLEQGIAWAMGRGGSVCRAGKEVRR